MEQLPARCSHRMSDTEISLGAKDAVSVLPSCHGNGRFTYHSPAPPQSKCGPRDSGNPGLSPALPLTWILSNLAAALDFRFL